MEELKPYSGSGIAIAVPKLSNVYSCFLVCLDLQLVYPLFTMKSFYEEELNY